MCSTVLQPVLTVLTVDWDTRQLAPEHVLRVLIPWIECYCLLIGGNNPRLHHLRIYLDQGFVALLHSSGYIALDPAFVDYTKVA